MELPIIHVYDGEWQFHEAAKFMADAGFVPAQIQPVNYHGLDMSPWVDVDCLFRPLGPAVREAGARSRNWNGQSASGSRDLPHRIFPKAHRMRTRSVIMPALGTYRFRIVNERTCLDCRFGRSSAHRGVSVSIDRQLSRSPALCGCGTLGVHRAGASALPVGAGLRWTYSGSLRLASAPPI